MRGSATVRRLRGDDDRRASAALVALAAAVAAVAGSYAVAGFTPAFVVAPVSALVVALTPDAVVTFSILVLGDLGDYVGLALAVGITLGLFAVVAGLARLLAPRVVGTDRTLVPVLGVGFAALGAVLLGLLLTGAVGGSVAAGVGAGLVVAVSETVSRRGPVDTDQARRSVLAGVATALGVGVVSAVLGSGAGRAGGPVSGGEGDGGGQAATLDVEESVAADIRDSLALAEERSLPVPGLEPLVSDTFYEVDIAGVDPSLSADDWTLSVTGAVDEEVTLDYEELRAMPAENRFVSLRCVGESLNGKKMDNALWTGVPLTDLLDRAGPRGEYVVLRAADGYYEEFPLSALRRGFLAFGMNGAPLPRAHGHPVRVLIPGHWGEINVKWVTSVEIHDDEMQGYWEKRGWHGTGPVNTVAKLHVVDVDDGEVTVAGHAYAGTRGVDRVEVSTDGGDSWTDATLSEPLPGEDVWRQWSYTYDSPGGPHEVVVRATDGTGTLQPRTEERAYPNGASGWVSRTVRP